MDLSKLTVKDLLAITRIIFNDDSIESLDDEIDNELDMVQWSLTYDDVFYSVIIDDKKKLSTFSQYGMQWYTANSDIKKYLSGIV